MTSQRDEPERELGQLDGALVLVEAVEAALGDGSSRVEDWILVTLELRDQAAEIDAPTDLDEVLDALVSSRLRKTYANRMAQVREPALGRHGEDGARRRCGHGRLRIGIAGARVP